MQFPDSLIVSCHDFLAMHLRALKHDARRTAIRETRSAAYNLPGTDGKPGFLL